jgi:hypothetical protein
MSGIPLSGRRCPLCRYRESTEPVCDACLRQAAIALQDFPVLYAALHTRLAGSRTARPSTGMMPAGRRQQRRRASQLPLELPPLVCAQQTAVLLRDWLGHYDPGALPQGTVREGWLVQHCCSHLQRAWPAALAVPQSHVYAGELLKLQHRARRILGYLPHQEPLESPCPSCELRTLICDHDAYLLRCRYCDATWPAHAALHLAPAP